MVRPADHNLITGRRLGSCLASNGPDFEWARSRSERSQLMDTVGTLEKFQEEGSAQIHPVILSGGAGTRLWPLSRASYPKQLLKLASERTMLQDTAARGLSDVGFAAPLLVCNEDHRFLVDDQLKEIGVKPQAILLEPLARNTGPAIAAAALWLLARDPDALMLVQPSDHVIASLADFHDAVMRGLAAAQEGRLVTFGVKPSRPDTGYGYIQSGKPVDGADGVFSVDRFVEKPDRADSSALRRQWSLFLEQRHLPAERPGLSRRALAHQPGHARCLRACRAGRQGRPHFLPPLRRLVRRGSRALDRPCRHGAYDPGRRRAGRHGVERRRLVARSAQRRPARRRR